MYKNIFILFCCGFFAMTTTGCTNLSKKHSDLAKPSLKGQSAKGNRKTYTVFGKSYSVLNSSKNYKAEGIASWYGRQFHRRFTSSGERFNMYKMTAAHKTLPLSTYVMVTNLKNQRKIVVKINDRGPFVGDRLIDLSYGAAKKLGMVGRGIAPVSVQVISRA